MSDLDDTKPIREPALEVRCPICCAKPGERCATIITCRYREPHAARIGFARDIAKETTQC